MTEFDITEFGLEILCDHDYEFIRKHITKKRIGSIGMPLSMSMKNTSYNIYICKKCNQTLKELSDD